jgi:hypothetical protein
MFSVETVMLAELSTVVSSVRLMVFCVALQLTGPSLALTFVVRTRPGVQRKVGSVYSCDQIRESVNFQISLAKPSFQNDGLSLSNS